MSPSNIALGVNAAPLAAGAGLSAAATWRVAASGVLGLAGLYYVWSGRRDQSLNEMLWGGVLVLLSALVF